MEDDTKANSVGILLRHAEQIYGRGIMPLSHVALSHHVSTAPIFLRNTAENSYNIIFLQNKCKRNFSPMCVRSAKTRVL